MVVSYVCTVNNVTTEGKAFCDADDFEVNSDIDVKLEKKWMCFPG